MDGYIKICVENPLPENFPHRHTSSFSELLNYVTETKLGRYCVKYAGRD